MVITTSKIQSLCILGAGQMGMSLAHAVAAKTKVKVTVYVRPGSVRWPEIRQKSSKSLVEFTDKLEYSAKSDMIIESVVEDLLVKKKILYDLSRYTREETIVASNSSTVDLRELCSSYLFPHKFIGLHFFYPVRFSKVVEVSVLDNPLSLVDSVITFIEEMGKRPYVNYNYTQCRRDEQTLQLGNSTQKDAQGSSLFEGPIEMKADFTTSIVNKIMIPMLRQGILEYEKQRKFSSIESFDNFIRDALNMPMGPLRLSDLIGLDTICNSLKTLKLDSPKSLRLLVDLGHLGRKTGKGFYEY